MELWIPDAVALELRLHPDPAAIQRIEEALHEGWIRVATRRESPLLRILELQLHAGEAETIALGIDLGADIVLIDEQEGRQFAARTGLCVTGVLGILLRAKGAGDIPAIKPEIDRLRSRAGFFVSGLLESQILAAAGE